MEHPEVSTFEALDSRVVHLWRLQALLGSATFLLPLFVVSAVGSASLLKGSPALMAVLPAITVAFLSLLVVQVGIWPVLAFRRFRYALRPHDLWIGRGVLFRQQTVVPLSRLQHVDTRQGPIERLLGLSRLLVYTASGMAPDGGIPGLDKEVARRLRDDLARRGGEDGL